MGWDEMRWDGMGMRMGMGMSAPENVTPHPRLLLLMFLSPGPINQGRATIQFYSQSCW